MKKYSIIIALLFVARLGFAQMPHITVGSSIQLSEQQIKAVDSLSVKVINVRQTEIKEDKYRNIHFIHGLGGTAKAWQRVPDACMNPNLNIDGFPARKCFAYSLDYSTHTSSLLDAANDLSRTIINSNSLQQNSSHSIDAHESILVGHSQGTMVIRQLLHNDAANGYTNYGGVIMLAGPLQGAQILNNRDQILNMAENACAKLIDPLLNSLINSLLKAILGDNYLHTGCAAILDPILPMFFKPYYAGITNDYTVGADRIMQLNNDVNSLNYRILPKITMYGIEPPYKIFWRTMQWMVNDPNSKAPFEANEDFTLWNNEISKVYNIYRTLHLSYQNMVDILDATMVFNLINPAYWITYSLVQEKYKAYQAAVDWFSTVNTEWEVIIGARGYRYTHGDVQYRCFPCEDGWMKANARAVPLQQCLDHGCTSIAPQVIYYWVSDYWENDGIVLAKSAKQLPCMTEKPIEVFPNKNIPNAPFQGSSHMQIRNDKGVKDHLNNALNGYYGKFFYTHPK